RQRDPGICGRPYPGGYPRDNFVGDACLYQCFALFAAPSEDERISAFEPCNRLAFQRLFDEQRVDLPLFVIVRSANLAGVDQLGMRRGEFKKLLVGEVIVDHNVGKGDALSPPDCDQSGATWTGANKINMSAFHKYFHSIANCSILPE